MGFQLVKEKKVERSDTGDFEIYETPLAAKSRRRDILLCNKSS